MSGTEIKTGRELDAETGLFFYRARYFSADLGRFLARDPLGFSAGDANLFRYCGNEPMRATDPAGLAPGSHHAYPLYLGGAESQPVWNFATPEAHTIAQNYLRERFPYGDAGRAAWGKLSDGEQRALIAQSLRAAGVDSEVIAANMDAMMAGAKPGEKIPRTGNYGKVIAVGTVVSALSIVATSPSIAQAGEISHDWRKSNDCTKGKVECATYREVVIVEAWWNFRSSILEGVDPVEFASSNKVSPWVYLGEMTAREAARFETGARVISHDSVLGYTVYNTERVRCRFNGKE